nr:MAG TPA: hypothetical protein [Caudoviricetes sp.]
MSKSIRYYKIYLTTTVYRFQKSLYKSSFET